MTVGRTAIAVAAALSFAATPPPALAQREAPEALVAAARAVTREVAALRRLPVRRPIDFQVSDRETIESYARQALAREMTPAQWDAYERLLVHVGLVPGDVDLRELVLALYAEQIAGYYDPDKKTFYLADWLPRLLQKAVVAHEVTHALQDQHFDLARWLAELSPTEDGALARAAVAEGDAMSAMLAYLLVPMGVEVADLPAVSSLLDRNAGAIAAAYPTFDEAPPALQRLLLFPYVEGADFVRAALRSGGWDAVDRLYRDPPVSTEQILHPERYWDARDSPTEVPIPAVGGELLTTGSWGEFGVRLILEAGLDDRPTATEAARGWDGDRYALARESAGRLAFAWSTVWDSAAHARRFADAYAQAVVRRFPGPARLATGEGRFAFEVSGRRTTVRREDSRVEIVETVAERGALPAAEDGGP